MVESDFNYHDVGLTEFSMKLSDATRRSFLDELAIIIPGLMLFNELDYKYRNGKTEEIKEEYETLCGGYEGDELMEIYRPLSISPVCAKRIME